MYGTYRGTLGEVRDGSEDPRKGPGRVGGPSGKSWKGPGTLPEVQDWSGYLPIGSERDRGPSGKS